MCGLFKLRLIDCMNNAGIQIIRPQAASSINKRLPALIPLVVMSSQTDFLFETLRKAEDLKTFLLKQRSLPVENFTATPPSIPPLQLPSADGILSNFKSSLPAEVLDRCASFLTDSEEAVQRNYERAYRALYSSTQPTQDQVYRLRYTCEQVYHRTSVSSVQHLMTLASQRTAKALPKTQDFTEGQLRTRFRQVCDRIASFTKSHCH